LNPGRRGGKPATNRLSYGAAIKQLTGTKIPLLQVPRTCFTMFIQSEEGSIQRVLPFLDPHIQFPNRSHSVTFRTESTIEFAFFQSLLFSQYFPKASCNMNPPSFLLRQNAALHEAKKMVIQELRGLSVKI
jgi:hypothetical protein